MKDREAKAAVYVPHPSTQWDFTLPAWDGVEMAWAAGLFEGEGSIHWTGKREGHGNTYRLVLQMAMTDKEPLDRFASIIGIGNVAGPYIRDERHSPSWAWTISGRRAEAVAERLIPLLGARRHEQYLQGRVIA